MTDKATARAMFDARLRQLGLTELAPQEIERLWASHLKQLEISARFDATVKPGAESALLLSLMEEEVH